MDRIADTEIDVIPITRGMTGKRWTSVPKAHLHIHLEGALNLDTVIEEFRRQQLPLNYNMTWEEMRKHFLMETPVGSLAKFIEKFDRQCVIFTESKVLTRVTSEIVVKESHNSVKLLELRYAPAYIAWIGKNKLSLHEIHEAVKAGVAKAVDAMKSEGSPIHVGLICIAVGAMGLGEFRKTVDFVKEHRDDFVGFDIAGAETQPMQYKEFMQEVHDLGLSITVHAGEDKITGLPDNVRVAVEHLHAKRIGHGIQIRRDPEVHKLVRDTKTHLEICPFSNYITGGVDSLSEHPIKQYLQEGLNVSVSTDDPGMFGTDINVEYELLHTYLNFGIKDFFAMNRNAVKASFLPESVKQSLLDTEFSAVQEAVFIKEFASIP